MTPYNQAIEKPKPTFNNLLFTYTSGDTESESDKEEQNGTLDTEIMFGASFMNNSGLLNRSKISPYDNFGDKTVGRDADGPVYMFVPKRGPEEGIKVGDQ